MSGTGSFRVIKVIRRGKGLARAGETAQAGKETPESLMSMLSLLPLVLTNPELLPIVGGVAGVAWASQYYQPGLGGWILPDSLSAHQYAEKIKRLTFEKRYGKDHGDQIYHDKFRTVQQELDLREKAP